MAWLKEQGIVDGLSDYKVTEVFIFKRTPRNTNANENKDPKPYGLMVITFNTQEPPKRIKYGFEHIEVRQYIPNPKRCKKCQKLGHTTKWCKGTTETCAECGQENTQNHNCLIKMCINCCKPGHASNSRDCPTYLMHKEWEAIMVLNKKTKYEAKQLFFSKYQSLEGFISTRNRNLAQIVGNTSGNQKQDTYKLNNKEPCTEVNKATTVHNNINKNTTANNNTNNQSKDNAKTNYNGKEETAGSSTKATKEDKTQHTNTSSDDVTTDDDNLSMIVNVSKNSDIIQKASHIKLKNWKYTETGIIFNLENNIRGEGLPKLDLTRFKGQKSARKEKILKYAEELLGKKDVLETIIKEVAGVENCKHIYIKAEKGRVSVRAQAEDEGSGSDAQMSGEEGMMSVDED